MKNILIVCSFCAMLLADSMPLTVSDGASYQTNAGISPGAIITLKGPNLSSVTMTAPDSTHPPTTLGGLTVTINDTLCQLYYISPTQVNAIVPTTVTPGYDFVVLQSPSGTAETSVLITSPSEMGLFTANGTGSGDGAILNASTYQEGPASVMTEGSPTYLALFGTSLDTTTMPTVWMGGISAPVQYFGYPGQYPGMEQINTQAPPQLQGAGRIEVVVQQGTLRSNAVQTVMLPNQPVFPNDQPDTIRSREVAAVAWVPGTSLALVADENDDVVRVVDLNQKTVTHVIALPDGAEPVAIGVHGSGTQAVVAERGRGAIAYLNLTAYNVTQEYPVGLGPSSVVVAGDQAVIANSDSDTVSFFNFQTPLQTPEVTSTVPVGRLPLGLAVDSQNAYVTNESAGTVMALNLTNQTVATTYNLGVDVRPASIRVMSDLGFAVIAEPSAGPGGKLIFLNTGNGEFTSLPQTNPANTGGASSIALVGDQIYLADQSGGSVTTTPVSILSSGQLTPSSIQITPVNFSSGLGTRSLDVDSKDSLLLMLNEGTETIGLAAMGTNSTAGSIDAVRSSPSDNTDDHSDRLAAPNLPTISSVTPAGIAGGEVPVTTNITITGTNLMNAEAILLIDPSTVPGLAIGLGNVNRGNFGVSDPAFTVSNIQANAAGTMVTAQVVIAANTQVRTRVVRVLTPNGETSLSNAPTFSIILQSN